MAIDYIFQNLRGLQTVRPDNYKFPVGLSSGIKSEQRTANGMSGTSDVFYKENPANPPGFGVDTSKETVYIFASPLGSSTFTSPNNLTGELLLVAGGGGAGGSIWAMGGGGGGGVYYNSNFPFVKDAVYTIEIGAGGAGALNRGGNTKFSSPAPIGLFYEVEGGGGGGIRADSPWPPGVPDGFADVGAGQPGGSGGGAGGRRGVTGPQPGNWGARGGKANTSYTGYGGQGNPKSTPYFDGSPIYGVSTSTPYMTGVPYSQQVHRLESPHPQGSPPTYITVAANYLGNPGGNGGPTVTGGSSQANTTMGGGGGGGAGTPGGVGHWASPNPSATLAMAGGYGGDGIQMAMLGPNPNYPSPQNPLLISNYRNGYGGWGRDSDGFGPSNDGLTATAFSPSYPIPRNAQGNAIGGGGGGGAYIGSWSPSQFYSSHRTRGGTGGGGTPGRFYGPQSSGPIICQGMNGHANTGGGAGAGSYNANYSTNMSPTPYSGGSGLVAIRFQENQSDTGYFID